MKKKRFAAMLAMALTVSVLAGCGGGSTESADADSAETAEQEATEPEGQEETEEAVSAEDIDAEQVILGTWGWTSCVHYYVGGGDEDFNSWDEYVEYEVKRAEEDGVDNSVWAEKSKPITITFNDDGTYQKVATGGSGEEYMQDGKYELAEMPPKGEEIRWTIQLSEQNNYYPIGVNDFTGSNTAGTIVYDAENDQLIYVDDEYMVGTSRIMEVLKEKDDIPYDVFSRQQ